MKTVITTLLIATLLNACGPSSVTTRGLHALDISSQNLTTDNTLELIKYFADLCLHHPIDINFLIDKAKSDNWLPSTKSDLTKHNLGRLKKQTIKISGGGNPVEETQIILTKFFEDKVSILVVSEKYARKKLTAIDCALYGKQDTFLENCARLGELINRAPDQNTKYEKSKAHFIGWNTTVSNNLARIKCEHTPQSPTLPYDGTQLSISIDYVTPLKQVNIKKSNQPQSGASAR